MRAVSAFRRMSSDVMVLLGPLRERTQSCECGYIRSVKLCQEVFLRVKGDGAGASAKVRPGRLLGAINA